MGNWVPDDAMDDNLGPFDNVLGKLQTLAMMKLGPFDDLVGKLGALDH